MKTTLLTRVPALVSFLLVTNHALAQQPAGPLNPSSVENRGTVPASGPTAPAAPSSANVPTLPPPAAANAATAHATRRLFVGDGQLTSHPFVVFVTHDITEKMDPKLTFRGMHLVTPETSLEKKELKPSGVFPGQFRQVTVDKQVVTLPGTLLLFNLSGEDLPFYKSAVRFVPSIKWHSLATADSPVKDDAIVGDEEIYIGNLQGAGAWTFLMLGTVFGVLLIWTRTKHAAVRRFPSRPFLFLITGPDGYLSLWRAQLIVWTAAIGGMVFLYGLTRLHVPEIPDPLVALMGMSVLTGTLSAMKAGSSANATPVVVGPPAPPMPPPMPVVIAPAPAGGGAPTITTPPVTPPPPSAVRAPVVMFNRHRAEWSDLISIFNKATGQVEVSVPKAQMAFWTVVILLLFIVKSLLLGGLWSVPWELVALTGVSQAGYIGDKLVQPT